MSDASVAGSFHARLAEHSPECGEVLASAMKNGTFRVTMLWQPLAVSMTDLLGGCVVVVTSAAKGEVYGGCVMGENAVMLLGQSASGVYVLRGIKALVWIDMVKALNASPHNTQGGAGGRQGRADRGKDEQEGDAGAVPVAGGTDRHGRRHRGLDSGAGPKSWRVTAPSAGRWRQAG